MDIYEMLFVIQLLVVIGVIGYKLYNIMNVGKLYDLKTGILLFCLWWLAYAIGSSIAMLQLDVLIYHVIYYLETWLIMFNIGFLGMEIIFHFKNLADEAIDRHRPDKVMYPRLRYSPLRPF